MASTLQVPEQAVRDAITALIEIEEREIIITSMCDTPLGSRASEAATALFAAAFGRSIFVEEEGDVLDPVWLECEKSAAAAARAAFRKAVTA